MKKITAFVTTIKTNRKARNIFIISVSSLIVLIAVIVLFFSMNKEESLITKNTKETTSTSMKESSSKKEESSTKQSTKSSNSTTSTEALEQTLTQTSSTLNVATHSEDSTSINETGAQVANSPVTLESVEIYAAPIDWDSLYDELVNPVKQRIRDHFSGKTYADTGQPYVSVDHYIEDTFKFLNHANYSFHDEESFQAVIVPVIEEYEQRTLERIEDKNLSYYALKEQAKEKEEAQQQ